MTMAVERKRLRIAENVVELDGVNIAASLAGVELAVDGRNCEAVLILNPGVDLELDLPAAVGVARAGSPDSIRRFLATVDPERLERVTLDRMTSGSLTSVMLDVLSEWSEGWEE